MKKIKIGIIGVGNCASALLQGIEYYKALPNSTGLITKEISEYLPSSIEVVCAFDVNANKVGKDVNRAIYVKPNCAKRLMDSMPNTGVEVKAGVKLDGVGNYEYHKFPVIEPAHSDDIVDELIFSGCEILINYLPVGSELASKVYAEAALEAGCSLINAIPVFIGTNENYQQRFKDKKLVIAGDDIKSQVGATIIHRTLVNLIKTRGQQIDNSYQLNFGGNTDFENMLDRTRLTSKEQSKRQSVTSQIPYDFDVKIGPSDFVPYLNDQKICYININGTQFGGTPFEIELKLKVEDSPNSAGVMVDAIRCVKVALDRGEYGYLHQASNYFFKTNVQQPEDMQALHNLKAWLDQKG